MDQPSSFFSLALKYLRYWFTSGHRLGYGIHSPYVYAFTRKVIYNEDRIQVPSDVKSYHRRLKGDATVLNLEDHGAGSRVENTKMRTVASIARKSSVTAKQGAFLYRLCRWFQPELVIEFGTGIGISTAHFVAGANGAKVLTVEGSKSKVDFAKKNMPKGTAGSVTFLEGHFDTQFKKLNNVINGRTLVFIDGDHRYRPTFKKVLELLNHAHAEELIIILDDIYWSEGMELAWKAVVALEQATITIDLFQLGIVIRRKGIEKQHFKILF